MPFLEVDERTLDEYRVLFRKFDYRKSGVMTLKGLMVCMHSLGLNPTEAELIAMTEVVNPAIDNNISLEDFLTILSTNVKYEKTERILENIFQVLCRNIEAPASTVFKVLSVRCVQVFDRDGDGYFTAMDLRTVLNSMGDKVSDAEAEAMVEEADLDGDHRISHQEFMMIMSHD